MIRFLLFFVVFLWANPLEMLNKYRTLAGLNILFLNNSLICASKMHIDYLKKNNSFSHYESILKFPFSRALSCGYESRFVIENLSKGEIDYKESIKDLFSAIYHRLGFLDFNINEIGFYNYKNIYVYEMGNSFINKLCSEKNRILSGVAGVCKEYDKLIPLEIFNFQMKHNPKVVVWPYDGMKNTPAVFYDEVPDPMPDYGVCGYPISISFNPYYFKNIKLVSFNLFLKNKKVSAKIIDYKNDINHLLKKTQFVLFPLKRLKYGKTYKVKAQFLIDGKLYNFSWSFQVEKQKNLLKVEGVKASFFIKPNITYFLYFKPLNKYDRILKVNYKYSPNLTFYKIGYKDANTLYFSIKGNSGKIVINANNRSVNLIVKEK